MRDPKRIPYMLEMLEVFWTKYLDQRLGQLVDNLCTRSKGLTRDIFLIEDDLIIQVLEEEVKKIKGN